MELSAMGTRRPHRNRHIDFVAFSRSKKRGIVSMKNRILILATAFFVFFFIILEKTKAQSYTIPFNDEELVDFSSTTGLWNTVDGRLEASVAPSGTIGHEVDFGDGSDGEFSNGSSVAGISDVGTTVTIDTDINNDFNFTNFFLDPGYTLEIQGNNALTIRARGEIRIEGTVDLSGEAGEDNSNDPGLGASAFARGGAGGNGGSTGGSASQAGGDPLVAGREGQPGPNTATSGEDKGGGGGCNGQGDLYDATQGQDASGGSGGGAAGSCSTYSSVSSDFETSFAGGAGGGGGGACVGCVNAASSGGGGGAGAGAVRLVALNQIQILGNILAQGGKGGDNSTGGTTDCGGGGGGGAGGSIWLQSAQGISGGGTINLSGGQGGQTPASCAAKADGGEGSRGVFRYDIRSSFDSISVTPAGDADNVQTLQSPASQTYTIVSNAIDLSNVGSNLASLNTFEKLGCGSDGTVDITYAGSTDGVSFGSFVDGTEIDSLKDSTHIKIRADITTTGSNPPCVQQISLYTDVSEFELEGGLFCGHSKIEENAWQKPSENSSIKNKGSPFLRQILTVIFLTGLIALGMNVYRNPNLKS
jgi:hypothetical protein